jgi:hypothetical protein
MSFSRRKDSVGILPVGSLGMAFFYHLTGKLQDLTRPVFFVERSKSGGHVAYSSGALLVADGIGQQTLRTELIYHGTLVACAESGLPEVLLVCVGSHQVLSVVASYVELLEHLYAWEGLEAAVDLLPLLVLCSNGIYYQRVRRFLVESLEESTLYGRLPELWSAPMGLIVGKLLRGVTIQTGRRDGDGPGAIYRPGPPGPTRLAGGELVHRRRCGAILQKLGGVFHVEEEVSPTRAEFDKALVNLFGNLLGQLRAIGEDGTFRPLTMKEILPEENSPETHELATHVFAVGRAVRAYGSGDDFEAIYRNAMNRARSNAHHVPSSLQWIEGQLAAGILTAKLTPTEKWLLEPLIQYASTAGLADSACYLAELTARVERKLSLLVMKQGVPRPIGS